MNILDKALINIIQQKDWKKKSFDFIVKRQYANKPFLKCRPYIVGEKRKRERNRARLAVRKGQDERGNAENKEARKKRKTRKKKKDKKKGKKRKERMRERNRARLAVRKEQD